MKTTLALLTSLVIFAGCAVSPPDDTVAFRPGNGVIEAVQPARVALPRAGSGAIAGSEAAGGSYGSPIERVLRPRWVEGYQLTLKMDDGTSQKITQDGTGFQIGDRVQITAEGRVVKMIAMLPSAPSAKPATPPVAAAPVSPAPSAPPAAPVRSYRPGIGVVESATVVSLSSSTSAAAGGASGPTIAYRVRMLDGSMQDVVQVGPRFNVGERVQLTREGRVVRP